MAHQLRVTGMEIDLLAEHQDTRNRALVECKFRKAKVSGSVVSEAVGKAYLRKVETVYVFSSSPPTKDAAGLIDENQHDPSQRIRIAFVGPDELVNMFCDVLSLSDPDIDPKLFEKYGKLLATTLLIDSEEDLCWALETGHDGIPSTLLLQPCGADQDISLEQYVADFERLEYWQGLDLELLSASGSELKPAHTSASTSPSIYDEVVSLVSSADRFDDYGVTEVGGTLGHLRTAATNFPKLWNDPQTPSRERKRMVRLLIEDVTLQRKEGIITAHIRFKGGATRTLNMPAPLNAWQKRKTSPQLVAEIDRLLDHHTESEIAHSLSKKGRLSPTGLPLTAEIVGCIRRAYGLKRRYHRLRELGYLPLAEWAKKLHVGLEKLKCWRECGFFKAHRATARGCLYELAPDGLDDLPEPLKHAASKGTIHETTNEV